MKVSLIIPTYKREELLVACLNCALNQNFTDYEVIVVDQTKDHQAATQEFLSNNSTLFTYVFNDIASAQRARNTGIDRATGAVIIIIDDDTTFGPDFVGAHFAAHQSGLDLVQGRIIEAGRNPSGQPSWMLPYIKVRGSDNCLTDGPTNNLTGANFSFSRRVVEAIGNFDERFHGPVLDDGDFAQRAWRSGFKMGYVARADVFHHLSNQGGQGDSKFMLFNRAYHRCNLLFARKHYPAWVRWYLKTRLLWRGIKQLRQTMKAADLEAIALLENRVDPFQLSR